MNDSKQTAHLLPGVLFEDGGGAALARRRSRRRWRHGASAAPSAADRWVRIRAATRRWECAQAGGGFFFSTTFAPQ